MKLKEILEKAKGKSPQPRVVSVPVARQRKEKTPQAIEKVVQELRRKLEEVGRRLEERLKGRPYLGGR